MRVNGKAAHPSKHRLLELLNVTGKPAHKRFAGPFAPRPAARYGSKTATSKLQIAHLGRWRFCNNRRSSRLHGLRLDGLPPPGSDNAQPREDASNSAAVRLGQRLQPDPCLQETVSTIVRKRCSREPSTCGTNARAAVGTNAHHAFALDIDANRSVRRNADQRQTRRMRKTESDWRAFYERLAALLARQ